MAELWANIAAGTLSGGITNVATAMSVQAGEGAEMPNPSSGDYFYLTIENEVVKVTARATDALTIVRAQQGTAAAAHADAVVWRHNWTAESARYAAASSDYSDWPHQPGQYYTIRAGAFSNSSIAKDQLRVAALWIPRDGTYVRIGVNCTGVATATFRPVIYRPSAGLPGALVADGGALDVSVTGFVEATISAALSRGWHFVGGVGQVVNATIQATTLAGNVLGHQMPGGSGVPVPSYCYYKTGVTGAAPDPFGTPSGLTTSAFMTWLRT